MRGRHRASFTQRWPIIFAVRTEHLWHRGQFTKGTQQVQLAELTGRYDDLLIEWAKVIRGEMKDRFGPEHDLLVEQCVLKASGVI